MAPSLSRAVCAGVVMVFDAAALHTFSRQPNASIPAPMGLLKKGESCAPGGAYRQQMTNFQDLQYHAEMTLGGQKLQGIVDTGSFELVVFSKSCATCGIAPAYDEHLSGKFVQGNSSQVHAYGSGSCKTQDGRDEARLGCYSAPAQDMWLAMDCQMPLLAQASFNAIVGVGPPGQPEFTAKQMLQKVDDMEKQLRAMNQTIPPEIAQAHAQAEQMLEDALTKRSMLDNFNMTSFSFCFGKASGSPAWMIWNDQTREDMVGVKKIPVVGNITWGVSLSNVTLSSATGTVGVGCKPSCGAIVDTGTSLMGVPTSVYNAMVMAINQGGWASDCSDLSRFPDLVMNVGGSELRFPPSSYIGSIYGHMNAEVSSFVHRDALSAQCQLLLMDLGEQATTLGPMFILGMPFFREYYTTFDLAQGRGTRSLFVSKAGEGCEPQVGAGVQQFAGRNRMDVTPRRLDGAHIRLPHWLKSRTSDAI